MEVYYNFQKTLLYLFILIFLLPVTAFAESGDLLVQAQLDPSISVKPINPVVQISPSGSGDLTGTFGFMVEANTGSVSLYAIVSKLYLDTDPTNTNVAPIDVNTATGVEFSPSAAKATSSSSLVASFTSTTTINKSKGLFDANQTEQINLQTDQTDGVFSQEIDLTTSWTMGTVLRPAGTYGGYITLFVSAVP